MTRRGLLANAGLAALGAALLPARRPGLEHAGFFRGAGPLPVLRYRAGAHACQDVRPDRRLGPAGEGQDRCHQDQPDRATRMGAWAIFPSASLPGPTYPDRRTIHPDGGQAARQALALESPGIGRTGQEYMAPPAGTPPSSQPPPPNVEFETPNLQSGPSTFASPCPTAGHLFPAFDPQSFL